MSSVFKIHIRSYIQMLLSKECDPALQSVFSQVLAKDPSAELRPPREGKLQTDESELGLQFAEISSMNESRMIERGGFVSTKHMFGASGARFTLIYTRNRHKVSILSPGFHFLPTEPVHQNDLRPFSYL